MTLRKRVTVSALVAVLVIVGLGGWLTYRFARAADASQALIVTSQPAADASRTLSTAYADAQVFLSAAILDAALAPTSGNAIESGCGDSETCYAQARRAAVASLTIVRDAFPEDTAVQQSVTASALAADEWQRVDATPVFALLGQGNVRAAAQVDRSPEAQSAADAMTNSGLDLQRLIDARRAEQVAEYSTFASRLAWALGIAGAALLLLTLAALGLLTRWVLDPLDALRAQLRAASEPDGRYQPIAVSGPPELAATGVDAESMRRQLVAQIDEAEAARQGLDQQGPVVAAIRSELEPTAEAGFDGLDIAGSLQPAEGVLAGDWWDAVRMPGGRVALIITDVAGHGPVAGIGAVRLKNVLGVALASGINPAAALDRAATAFRDEDSRFATCAIVVLDPVQLTVTWANAGHPPPLLRRADGARLRLEPTGPLISGLGGSWELQQEVFRPGDRLVLWSDGLAESHDADGQELGDEGLLNLVDATAVDDPTPGEMLERMLAQARQRAVDWRRDDVTLAVASLSGGAIS